MADKKCTIFIVDVGPTMWEVKRDGSEGSTALDLARKALLAMLEAKVTITSILRERLIVFGTDETSNQLNEQTGEYENITTLYPIEQPQLPILRTVNNNMPRGNVQADAFDAMIVSLNMIEEHCKKLKYTKKIYLFTDGESPINQYDFDRVSSQILSQNIELNILGVDFEDPDIRHSEENKTENKKRNEQFLRKLADKCKGTIFSMEYVLRQLSKPYIRPVKPTSVYRGTLTLGDPETYKSASLVIDVELIARSMKAKLKSFKKYSALAETANNIENKTYEVSQSRTYSITVDENVNEKVDVPQDELDRAYALGKTFIPISKQDENVFSFESSPCLSIISFIGKEEFRRELILLNVFTVVSKKDDPVAAQRLSSFIHVLYEKDSYAIVRFVKKNFEPPKLGVLIPYIKPPKECLYFARIPFKEDYRRFTFPSLDRIVSKTRKELEVHEYLPTEEMLNKMGKFIEDLDLMNAAIDDDGNPREYLKVKECFNPVNVMIKKAVSHKALYPEEPLPQPDPALKAQTRMLPSLVEKNKELVNEMRSLFKIKEVKGKGKTTKRRFADANVTVEQNLSLDQLLSNGKHEDLEKGKRSKTDNGDRENTLMLEKQEPIREVSLADPVGNFKEMIANREEDLVTTAVEQMCQVVEHFVKSSFGTSLYDKALECLNLLRETCAKENESELFNKFLRELKTIVFTTNPPRTNFWELLERNKLSLIINTEADDSMTTEKEAEEFLKMKLERKSIIETADEEQMPTDELLNLMDDD
ncbi:13242_t:CDS:10 [Funneliformis caledonium]|uniref:ATP-dependent DNA helicase II subunit 2 n=1 Tax=Funneliformis caledonium TaxID=1117310 RepID=A0A9N9FIJ1_9GLOM|nr:13242_t:CDS:10 [Funneliformis caledonium]